jgi:hypothetical protein
VLVGEATIDRSSRPHTSPKHTQQEVEMVI